SRRPSYSASVGVAVRDDLQRKRVPRSEHERRHASEGRLLPISHVSLEDNGVVLSDRYVECRAEVVPLAHPNTVRPGGYRRPDAAARPEYTDPRPVDVHDIGPDAWVAKP